MNIRTHHKEPARPSDDAFSATQLAQLEEIIRRVVHVELAAHEEAAAAQRLERAGVEYEEYLKAKGVVHELV